MARTSAGLKYFGDHPDRSIHTFALWVAIEIASSCQGTLGWAMMIDNAGCRAATSSRSIGLDSPEVQAKTPGHAGTDPGLTGVDDDGQAEFLDRPEQRHELLTRRVEALHGGVEFEAAHAELSGLPCSFFEGRPPCRGSTEPNATSVSGWRAAPAAMSSMLLGACPDSVVASTVNTTAIMSRWR